MGGGGQTSRRGAPSGVVFPVAGAQLLLKRLAAGNKRSTRRLFDGSTDLVSKVVERVMENQILLGQPPSGVLACLTLGLGRLPACGFTPRPAKRCKKQRFRFMPMTLPVE